MSRYYDRQGRPIDINGWVARLKLDQRVSETTLPNGKWVSTVWLGLDHSFGGSLPLIFETMVFTERGGSEEDCERYSTEEEATAGHARMIEKYSTVPA